MISLNFCHFWWGIIFSRIEITVIEAKDLPCTDIADTADPYVVVELIPPHAIAAKGIRRQVLTKSKTSIIIKREKERETALLHASCFFFFNQFIAPCLPPYLSI